jgi:D-alanine-D-alanine ligase
MPDHSVLILHNAPPADALESEKGVLAEVAAVAGALGELRIPHRIAGVAESAALAGVLAAAPEAVVFNLVEGFPGDPAAANAVPDLCRAAGKECTGNSTAALALALDKARAKAALQAAGLPCPGGVQILPGEAVPHGLLPRGTVILKPAATDASEGIDEDGVLDSADSARLEAVLRRLHAQFRQPVLVEPFIDGRELNVAAFEQAGELRVLPLAEIEFAEFAPGKPRIVGYRAKWDEGSFECRNTRRVIPAPLPEAAAARLRALVRAAWRACGLRDYARVDFRLDAAGEPFILEVNPNPDIAPDAGFAAALAAGGVPFREFVEMMVANARGRLATATAAARP